MKKTNHPLAKCSDVGCYIHSVSNKSKVIEPQKEVVRVWPLKGG